MTGLRGPRLRGEILLVPLIQEKKFCEYLPLERTGSTGQWFDAHPIDHFSSSRAQQFCRNSRGTQGEMGPYMFMIALPPFKIVVYFPQKST